MLTHQTLNAKNPTCCTTMAGFDSNAQFRSLTSTIILQLNYFNNLLFTLKWFCVFLCAWYYIFPLCSFLLPQLCSGTWKVIVKTAHYLTKHKSFFLLLCFSLFFLFPFWLSEYNVIFIFSKNLTKLGVLVRINYWGEKILLHSSKRYNVMWNDLLKQNKLDNNTGYKIHCSH